MRIFIYVGGLDFVNFVEGWREEGWLCLTTYMKCSEMSLDG